MLRRWAVLRPYVELGVMLVAARQIGVPLRTAQRRPVGELTVAQIAAEFSVT